MHPLLLKMLPVIRVLALSALGFGALVYFVQRRIAFPGTFVDVPRSSPTAPDDVEQVWLATGFGRVEAWLFAPPPSASAVRPAPAVIYAHGNGELIDDWVAEMRELSAAGLNVMAVEFPGYGFSEGKPSRSTIRATFASAFDTLAARPDVDADRIVAYGRSMGGGAAGDLARHRPVAALVLQSTFSSTAAVARAMLVPGFLVRDRFDNVAAVREFRGPVLLMHGPDDEVLPFAHARAIATSRPGLEVTVIDCGHNDCGRVWPDIRDTIISFLRAEGVLDSD